MNFKEFEEHQEKLFNELRALRDTKGKEYAHDEDRFANFNRIAQEIKLVPLNAVLAPLNNPNNKTYTEILAEFANGDPLIVLYVYLKKHWDSFTSYVMNGGQTFSTESIHGRIMDLIMYLMLADGMITEKESKCVTSAKPIK